MIRLDTTTRKLQALLGATVTTNQMQCVANYSDATQSGYVGATTVINTNNSTAVDIVPAPAAGVRDVDYINIYNRDTVSQSVTVRYNDNGTTYVLIVATLLTGEQLNYTHGSGWCALDANGNRKEAIGPVPSSSVLGTTTNDNAAAGRIGEYIESVVGPVNFGTSGQYSDLTSISLTAGDWDVSSLCATQNNGATVTTWLLGISTTSGNSGTGLVVGSNRAANVGPTAASDISTAIPPYRMSLASTTTVYCKLFGSYTVATPIAYARLSARRVR